MPYAVYVIVIEDTEEDFEAVMTNSIDTWGLVDDGVSHDRAMELVKEAEELTHRA